MLPIKYSFLFMSTASSVLKDVEVSHKLKVLEKHNKDTLLSLLQEKVGGNLRKLAPRVPFEAVTFLDNYDRHLT